MRKQLSRETRQFLEAKILILSCVFQKIAQRVSAVDQLGWDEAKQERCKKFLIFEYTSSDESEFSEDETGPDVKRFVTKRLT